VRTLLDQIEQEYPLISSRQRKVLDLQRAGDRAGANRQLDVLNDLQRLVQDQRASLQARMGTMVSTAVLASTRHQRYVFALTIAATISSVLLGLGVATMIVRRLTRPVRSLMDAMRDVQGGNLDVRLPVRSADEVGALTESFNFFVGELKSKAEIKRTFGKYVDPRVLEQLLLQPGQAPVDTTGGRRTMTVLFADLVGFSSMSEKLTPARMVDLLNRHFGLQAQAVQEHLGVVDKFLGDAVMAFWGPPFVKPADHAVLACRAARAQVQALQALRREIPELTGLRKDAPTIDLRVGLCSGEVVVGNIGSENTRNFTVIGDTVNLTSRIEGANRVYGTQILIGETTAAAIAGQFETREIDSLAVKGKAESARVFELLGPPGTLSDEERRLCGAYADALRAYRARTWDQAEAAFNQCLQIRPTDGPSATMLKRLPTLRQSPPAEGWNGTWQLTEK
jgi:adenylate cyclase